MSNNTKTVLKIGLKIENIERIAFFENYHDFLEKKSPLLKSKVKTDVSLKFHKDKNLIEIIVNSVFSLFEKKKRYDLFGVTCSYQFLVEDLSTRFYDDEIQKYNLPQDFLLTLLNITIAGARGIVAISRKNPCYQNLNIPLLDARKILNDLLISIND